MEVEEVERRENWIPSKVKQRIHGSVSKIWYAASIVKPGCGSGQLMCDDVTPEA